MGAIYSFWLPLKLHLHTRAVLSYPAILFKLSAIIFFFFLGEYGESKDWWKVSSTRSSQDIRGKSTQGTSSPQVDDLRHLFHHHQGTSASLWAPLHIIVSYSSVLGHHNTCVLPRVLVLSFLSLFAFVSQYNKTVFSTLFVDLYGTMINQRNLFRLFRVFWFDESQEASKYSSNEKMPE